jgi:hypothetical protein
MRHDRAALAWAEAQHWQLAVTESEPERFFINVALARVLYAYPLIAASGLALGRFAPLGRLLGDPRLGMAGAFLSLGRVLPNRYPRARDVQTYIAREHRLGRMLDHAVIAPRLQRVYEWSAAELRGPRRRDLIRDGNPTYAWPSRSDTCGAPRACPSQPGSSKAPHALAEALSRASRGPPARTPRPSSRRPPEAPRRGGSSP